MGWLREHQCEFATPILYKTISNDIKEIVSKGNFDVICFFTASGVKSLFENFPKFKQNGTYIGTFGANTSKAAEEAGLKLQIKAPEPQAPSMVSALEKFLNQLNK
jgi:uroporphyrinogen-III synthase